jgi:predicted DNA-binding ribbon-helix-helix protein
MLIKRSITINKHRTSLSLESEFWEALKKVSKIKNCSIESLITRIDLNRKTSLASSTRVYLLQFFKNN